MEGQEDWRVNPAHGYSDYRARRPRRPVISANSLNGEVARWLGEECLPENSTPEQVKGYMQNKAFDFPITTTIARDYLSIPATSAPSERAFRLAGNLISKKRGRIASKNVRYVLCLRSWGFLVDNDDEDEIIIDENGCIIEPVDGVVPASVVVVLEEENLPGLRPSLQYICRISYIFSFCFDKNIRYTMDLPGFVPGNTSLGGEYPKIFIWMDTRATCSKFQVWKRVCQSPLGSLSPNRKRDVHGNLKSEDELCREMENARGSISQRIRSNCYNKNITAS